MSKLIVNTIEAQTYKYDSDTTGLTLNSDGTFNRGTIPYWGLKSQTSADVAANGTILWEERADSFEAVIGQSLGGGCTYNTSNGQVTVPVSGVYQVNVHANARSNNSSYVYVGLEIVVNGAEIEVANYSQAGAYTTWRDVSFSTVIKLDANDTIRVDNYYGHAIQIDTGRWSGFSGYLVG